MSSIGNAISIPFQKQLIGLSSVIQAEIAYWLGITVEGAIYPNKIGDQDREELGGTTFPGRANAFDGLDQYAYIADNGALDVNQASTDFVLSGFIKTGSDITTAQFTFGKNIGASVDGRYGFSVDTNVLNAIVESSGGPIVIPDNITLTTNTEYHVVLRVDRSGKKIYYYIDSILQNAGGTSYTGTIGSLNNSYKFYMGCGNNVSPAGNPELYLEGQIRDVRVYHKDITSAANLAALQKGERLGDEVAWWFCEGTDTLEVFDASGNGYHMTAENFDSTSFVEGNWQSLMNKYGYAINVDDLVDLNVSNCENSNYSSFSNATPNGFDAESDGNGTQFAGTADEISIVDTQKYVVTFNLTLNSGTAPGLVLQTAIGGENLASSTSSVAGNNEVEFTATGTTTGVLSFFNISTTTDYEITNLSVQKNYYDTPIPPDMSTTVNGVPQQDIFGNDLTFKGQAKYNAIARDRSCFIGDDVAYFTPTSQIVIDPNSDSFEIEFGMYIGTRDELYAAAFYDTTTRVLFNDSNFFFVDNSNNVLSAWTNLKAAITDNTYNVIKFVGNGINIVSYHNGIEMDTLSAVSLTDNITITTNCKIMSNGNYQGLISWAKGVFEKITVNSVVKANWQFVEGSGNTVYDVSGNENHLTGVNTDDSSWGVIDTPEEDYLAEHGVTIVEYSGITRLVPFLSSKVSQYDDVSPVINASETYIDYPQNGRNLIPQTYLSMPENIYELYDADQEERYEGGLMDEGKGTF
ncbi:hypothetical protein LCGC14_1687220, partial [marine sediment metagenome]